MCSFTFLGFRFKVWHSTSRVLIFLYKHLSVLGWFCATLEAPYYDHPIGPTNRPVVTKKQRRVILKRVRAVIESEKSIHRHASLARLIVKFSAFVTKKNALIKIRTWANRERFQMRARLALKRYEQVLRAAKRIQNFVRRRQLRLALVAQLKAYNDDHVASVMALQECEQLFRNERAASDLAKVTNDSTKPFCFHPSAKFFFSQLDSDTHTDIYNCLVGLKPVSEKNHSNNARFHFYDNRWHLTFGFLLPQLTGLLRKHKGNVPTLPILYTVSDLRSGSYTLDHCVHELVIPDRLNAGIYQISTQHNGVQTLIPFDSAWHGGLIISTKRRVVIPKGAEIIVAPKVVTPFVLNPTLCPGCKDLMCFCDVIEASSSDVIESSLAPLDGPRLIDSSDVMSQTTMCSDEPTGWETMEDVDFRYDPQEICECGGLFGRKHITHEGKRICPECVTNIKQERHHLRQVTENLQKGIVKRPTCLCWQPKSFCPRHKHVSSLQGTICLNCP